MTESQKTICQICQKSFNSLNSHLARSSCGSAQQTEATKLQPTTNKKQEESKTEVKKDEFKECAQSILNTKCSNSDKCKYCNDKMLDDNISQDINNYIIKHSNLKPKNNDQNNDQIKTIDALIHQIKEPNYEKKVLRSHFKSVIDKQFDNNKSVIDKQFYHNKMAELLKQYKQQPKQQPKEETKEETKEENQIPIIHVQTIKEKANLVTLINQLRSDQIDLVNINKRKIQKRGQKQDEFQKIIDETRGWQQTIKNGIHHTEDDRHECTFTKKPTAKSIVTIDQSKYYIDDSDFPAQNMIKLLQSIIDYFAMIYQ